MYKELIVHPGSYKVARNVALDRKKVIHDNPSRAHEREESDIEEHVSHGTIGELSSTTPFDDVYSPMKRSALRSNMRNLQNTDVTYDADGVDYETLSKSGLIFVDVKNSDIDKYRFTIQDAVSRLHLIVNKLNLNNVYVQTITTGSLENKALRCFVIGYMHGKELSAFLDKYDDVYKCPFHKLHPFDELV